MEKQKNSQRQARLALLRQYWLAYLAGILFFISSVVYVFEQPGWLGLKTGAVQFSFVTLGIYGLPASILFFIEGFFSSGGVEPYFYPPMVNYFILVMLNAGIAVIVTVALMKLYRFRRVFRVLVRVSVLVHLLVAFAVLSTARAFPPPERSDDCLLQINDRIALRLTLYTYRDSPTGLSGSSRTYSQAVYSQEQNGGKSIASFWDSHAKCADFMAGAGDDNTLWIVHPGNPPQLLITHDSGAHWFTWSLMRMSTVLPRLDWEEVRDGKISEVHFEDSLNATLVIAYYDYDSKTDTTMTLMTGDGGKNWRPE